MLLERLARWWTTRRRDDLGARGERLAAAHLRGLGYRVLAMNWRCEIGEIDVVCRDGDVLVIVEVKSRQSDDVTPEAQVSPAKESQVGRVAEANVRRHFGGDEPLVRFDIVAVVWPQRGKPIVRHHVDAFAPS